MPKKKYIDSNSNHYWKEIPVVRRICTSAEHAGKVGPQRQLVEEHNTLPTCKRARLSLW